MASTFHISSCWVLYHPQDVQSSKTNIDLYTSACCETGPLCMYMHNYAMCLSVGTATRTRTNTKLDSSNLIMSSIMVCTIWAAFLRIIIMLTITMITLTKKYDKVFSLLSLNKCQNPIFRTFVLTEICSTELQFQDSIMHDAGSHRYVV